MFGSDALLDSAGSGNEVDCFQGVLQRISNPRGSARTNANRNADIETHRLQLIPLAETLSRPVSDTNGSMSTNSPGTSFFSCPNENPLKNDGRVFGFSCL